MVFIVYFVVEVIYPPVAQSVEQLPFKEMVVGSIPTGRTSVKKIRTASDF